MLLSWMVRPLQCFVARLRHLAAAGLCLGGLLASAGITEVRAETLHEAIQRTMQTNPEVQIDVARRRATDEAVNQAIGGYLPRVDLTLGRGKQQTDNSSTLATYGGQIDQNRRDRSLTISQMLFDGFGTSSEVDRNRFRVESSAHKVASTSEQTSLKAVEAYLEVLRQAEIIRLTKENLSVHERTYDQIKLRASSGVGRKSDQDQIEARLALAKSNLIAAEAHLIVARINYKLVVGENPGELIKPLPPDLGILPKTPDEAVGIAVGSNRILKSAAADVEAANAQHAAAKAAMYPRLDLELGVQKNELVSPIDSVPDNSKYLMLRMRYNLFKGGTDLGRVGETRHQAYEAEEVMQRAQRQLEQSVRLSWNAFRSALDRLPDLRKHAEASLLTRDAYSKQFSLGQRTLLDLLDTENEYYTASTNFINGQYVELFSRFRVLADIGMLFDTLGIPHLEEAGLSAR